MRNKWVIKQVADSEHVQQLANELNIHPILSSLLIQRGHDNFEKAKRFFRPELNMLHDPFLMKDMEKAVSRIDDAIRNHEPILLYGDYDVDGTTAVSLLYKFLRKRTSNLSYYIPNRYTEGYGISKQGIEWAKENGYKLIISLDCGIKAVSTISHARSLGIDFIVCDHHRPGEILPAANAILDPKQEDCPYPFKELSGCGVGFKLAQALLMHRNEPSEELESYLDLLVVSIAADIVPITGENRVLAYYGLRQLNNEPSTGIRAILDISNTTKKLSINDIVFIIAPRINAAGRIESGKLAVELLIADDQSKAHKLAQDIDTKNTTRKGLNEKITREALEQISNDIHFDNRKSTVLYNPKWHKGVIGIVASKLTDEYYRPTIVLTRSDNGIVSGSARSVKDFDIYNAIESCSDLLEQFGGHMYAAGLTLREENIPAFSDKFEDVVNSTIKDHMLVREIEIDNTISFHEITQSFVNILKQFEPFGPENMAPVFMADSVVSSTRPRIVGNNHLKVRLAQTGNSKLSFDGIGFTLGGFSGKMGRDPMNVCFCLEENHFNGRTNIQLNIKDIAV